MTTNRPAKDRFLRDLWAYRMLPDSTVHLVEPRIEWHAELIGAVEISVPAMRAMAEMLQNSKDPAAMEVVGRLELLAEQFADLLTPQKLMRAI
ncbi:hypothetical protein [Pandoraea sputorum]